MKKMLSLAAMFAVLAYASPASAELKLGGDASVRLRDTSYTGDTANTKNDDLVWQYRVRLNASADLGDGYFFKALVMDENNAAGGWKTVGYGNTEAPLTLNVSNFYFGRMLKDCHYMVGRLPLGSFNNPIFDLTLYPTQPLENPVANINYDRVYGANYGTKIGDGMLNATLVVLDNESGNDTHLKGDGLLNDGYALHLDYKFNVGDVTLEPQFLTVLTNSDIWTQSLTVVHSQVTPYTFGALVGVPAGKLKLGFGAFFTDCNDSDPNSGAKTNYDGYQLRVKGEYGNFMAWYDYNHTTDKSGVTDVKYTNNFVWAQYKIPVYSSAAGSFTIQPTLRYLTNKTESNGVTYVDQQRLRSELWATVTF
ncbi:MAG: porin [Chlorobaculum sp.]|nr:porin [Chlorobaculum sp.]